MQMAHCTITCGALARSRDKYQLAFVAHVERDMSTTRCRELTSDLDSCFVVRFFFLFVTHYFGHRFLLLCFPPPGVAFGVNLRSTQSSVIKRVSSSRDSLSRLSEGKILSSARGIHFENRRLESSLEAAR